MAIDGLSALIDSLARSQSARNPYQKVDINALAASASTRRALKRILAGGWDGTSPWVLPQDHVAIGNSQYTVEDVLRGRGGDWAKLIDLMPKEYLALPARAPVDNNGNRVDQIGGNLHTVRAGGQAATWMDFDPFPVAHKNDLKESGFGKIMSFLPAVGALAVTGAGLAGLLPGAGAAGGAAAAGGASATGGAVATALPVTTTSTAGITTSALSPLATGTGVATGVGGTGLALGGGTGLSVGGGTGLTTTGATLGGGGLATGTGTGLATGTGGLGLKVGGGLGLVEGGGLGLKAALPEVAMSGGGFFSKLGSTLGSVFGGPGGRLLTNIIGGWVADEFTDGPFDGYNIDPSKIDDFMSKAEDAIRLATERNEELFNYRFGKAKQLIDEESGYFNPDYFAQQSMARARNMNAAARREGLRGVTGDAAANLSRKYDLDAVRGMGTAYDSGYATGVQGRLQTMTTGLQFLPNEYPNYSRDYAALASPYLDMERLKMEMAKANWDAKNRNAAGIGKLGGDAIDFGTDMFGWVGKGIDKGIDFIGGLFD